MMSMILMLTFLFIFMRFHGWHLTAELPLGERAPWHPPCLESHRGFEWVAVPWDAKSVIFMLGAPFQWQIDKRYVRSLEQNKRCKSKDAPLWPQFCWFCCLVGACWWPHSHFLDVVAIPQNTRPIVASFPICVDSSPNMWPKPMPSFVLGWLVDLGKAYIVVPGNSLMDWIYGHKQTVIFQISGKERVPSPTIGSVWRKC